MTADNDVYQGKPGVHDVGDTFTAVDAVTRVRHQVRVSGIEIVRYTEPTTLLEVVSTHDEAVMTCRAYRAIGIKAFYRNRVERVGQ